MARIITLLFIIGLLWFIVDIAYFQYISNDLFEFDSPLPEESEIILASLLGVIYFFFPLDRFRIFIWISFFGAGLPFPYGIYSIYFFIGNIICALILGIIEGFRGDYSFSFNDGWDDAGE